MDDQSDQQDGWKSETVNTRPEFMRQRRKDRERQKGKEVVSLDSNGRRERDGKTERKENKQTDSNQIQM